MANEEKGGRNESGKRKRQLLSINDQIDKIQDVYFRNYTQNIDRRISSLAERQSRMLSQLYDGMEKEEQARLKKSFNDRQEAMRQSLEDWRDYNKQIRSDLSFADRFATDVLYWNRRRNLRDLEREARYRFDDIADEAEEAAEKISDNFSSIADSLRDWSVALNVNELASGLEDSQKSMREIRTEMQKYVSISEDEWKAMRTHANELSKASDYAIANTEYLEKMSEIISVYDDKEFASDIADYATKMGYFGLDATEMDSMFELAKGDSDLTNLTMSQMALIQSTDGLFTTAEELMGSLDEHKNAILGVSNDPEEIARMMQENMALQTAANASYLDGLPDKLFEIMATPMSEMSTDMLMLGGAQIQQLMNSGDFKGAAEIFATNLNSTLTKLGNDSARTEYLNALGFDDPELQAKLMQGESITEFFDAYDEAMRIMDSETVAAEKYLDTWNNTGATALEKFNNKFKTSALGSKLNDIADELDITLAEAMMIGSGAINIGKSLASGVKGLGKLFGIGGSGSSAAGAAGGAASKGLFAKLLGSAGSTASGALAGGSGLLGMFSSAGAALGSGAASAGGLAAAGASGIGGGILGGVGLISGIVDIVKGATSDDMTQKEKQDKYFSGGTKIGMVGAGAGVGAAIGSVVPGLGTAIGALVGAGVGGIGALISGTKVGEALSDAWDWTKEKAVDLWDNVSEWGSETWGNIKDWAGSTWDKVTTGASNMWDKAKNFGIDAFNTAVGAGDMAMDGLFNAMGWDWDGFKTKVATGWEDIKTWGTNAWTSVKDWASTTWDTISTKASETWSNITTWASEKWTSIKDSASQTWDNITTKATEVWDGITTKASEAWDSVQEFGQDAVDAIGDWWDNSTIKSGIDAIGDGLVEGWNKFTDFLSGAKEHGEEITGVSGSHALGLRYVPYDGYLAELHEGEAVLTEAQANNWRNKSLDEAVVTSSSSQASWAPNDKSAALSAKETVIINNQITETVDPQDDDDATLTEVIEVLREICKDIKKTIEECTSEEDDKTNIQKLMQELLKAKLNNSTSSALYNFVR